jgi:hypothetical protein
MKIIFDTAIETKIIKQAVVERKEIAIKKYQTMDGKVFSDKTIASKHEELLRFLKSISTFIPDDSHIKYCRFTSKKDLQRFFNYYYRGHDLEIFISEQKTRILFESRFSLDILLNNIQEFPAVLQFVSTDRGDQGEEVAIYNSEEILNQVKQAEKENKTIRKLLKGV